MRGQQPQSISIPQWDLLSNLESLVDDADDVPDRHTKCVEGSGKLPVIRGDTGSPPQWDVFSAAGSIVDGGRDFSQRYKETQDTGLRSLTDRTKPAPIRQRNSRAGQGNSGAKEPLGPRQMIREALEGEIRDRVRNMDWTASHVRPGNRAVRIQLPSEPPTFVVQSKSNRTTIVDSSYEPPPPLAEPNVKLRKKIAPPKVKASANKIVLRSRRRKHRPIPTTSQAPRKVRPESPPTRSPIPSDSDLGKQRVESVKDNASEASCLGIVTDEPEEGQAEKGLTPAASQMFSVQEAAESWPSLDTSRKPILGAPLMASGAAPSVRSQARSRSMPASQRESVLGWLAGSEPAPVAGDRKSATGPVYAACSPAVSTRPSEKGALPGTPTRGQHSAKVDRAPSTAPSKASSREKSPRSRKAPSEKISTVQAAPGVIVTDAGKNALPSPPKTAQPGTKTDRTPCHPERKVESIKEKTQTSPGKASVKGSSAVGLGITARSPTPRFHYANGKLVPVNGSPWLSSIDPDQVIQPPLFASQYPHPVPWPAYGNPSADSISLDAPPGIPEIPPLLPQPDVTTPVAPLPPPQEDQRCAPLPQSAAVPFSVSTAPFPVATAETSSPNTPVSTPPYKSSAYPADYRPPAAESVAESPSSIGTASYATPRALERADGVTLQRRRMQGTGSSSGYVSPRVLDRPEAISKAPTIESTTGTEGSASYVSSRTLGRTGYIALPRAIGGPVAWAGAAVPAQVRRESGMNADGWTNAVWGGIPVRVADWRKPQ